MKKVMLYTLSHPVTGEIKYVGKTTDTLSRRLAGHIYDSTRRFKNKTYRWIQELMKAGLRPVITLLEEVGTDWEYWEGWHIAMFKAWGFELTNTSAGGEFIGKGHYKNLLVA